MTEPFGARIRDPQEWMREQEQRSAALIEKAEHAKSELAANIVTHSSPDGLVTVTVNPGGGLDALVLSPQAQGKPVVQLSALIMSTYRQATTKAADKTLEIMAGLTGRDSEAVEFIKSTLPPREEPESEPPADPRFSFDDQETPPPPPPPRPPRPQTDDDDGEDFQNVDWTGRT
jgi:DNA-binding protein YbaB